MGLIVNLPMTGWGFPIDNVYYRIVKVTYNKYPRPGNNPNRNAYVDIEMICWLKKEPIESDLKQLLQDYLQLDWDELQTFPGSNLLEQCYSYIHSLDRYKNAIPA